MAQTRASELWFGKHVSADPGTELGEDAKGQYGKVSKSHRWFPYEWWFGHHLTREHDGTWKDTRGFGRRRSSGLATKARGNVASSQDYALYCHERHMAAESATHGHMVTPAGKARGITGSDFFDPDARRRPGRKWMTEELRGWFGDGDAAGGHHGSRGGLLSKTAFTQQTRQRAA